MIPSARTSDGTMLQLGSFELHCTPRTQSLAPLSQAASIALCSRVQLRASQDLGSPRGSPTYERAVAPKGSYISKLHIGFGSGRDTQ